MICYLAVLILLSGKEARKDVVIILNLLLHMP
nr:MAG TPA: hypothetical protein [Bacteriophage sp.]